MNSDKNKRENRKALKIFIPIIFAAAGPPVQRNR